MGLLAAFNGLLPHPPEKLGLFNRVVERVVSMTTGRILKFLWYSARPGAFPRNSAEPHVVGLDVDSADPERVLAEILMKIEVNEGPIQSSIEAHEHELSVL